MKYKIKHKISGSVLFETEAAALKIAIEMAVTAEADLRGANLGEADLREANLRGANLGEANLRGADLRGADLREANLGEADLREANLREADLDFSSGIQFRCNTFGFKADLRLAAQMAYHFCRIEFQDCEEAKEAQQAIKALANKFHRVNECGKIE